MASQPRPERGGTISKQFLFLALSLAAIVGFIAGTRGQELLAVVAPVLGIHVETGTLDLATVQETYQQLKAHYDGTLNEQDLIDGASRGLVAAAGDRYTVYMSGEDAQEFEKDLNGDIGGGIGVEIGLRNDQPTIIRVLDDNPAGRAGVRVGDIIVAVNDESTHGFDTDKVAAKVRGEVGTTIKLGVVRGHDKKDFSITRAIVNNPSVYSYVRDGIGVLVISRFDDNTGKQARTAAQNLKKAGVKGLIVDLRGNGGGTLPAAQDVAGIWLNDKLVVSTKTQDKTVLDELTSDHNAILRGMKTVVLVNGDTASASEIVAGALRDHGAATLLGEKTFGKGSVQSVVRLSGGAELKVTVAKWYTPKGTNVNKVGLAPNKTVVLTKDDANAGRDPQLGAAFALFP